jgi:hypothetical protein
MSLTQAIGDFEGLVAILSPGLLLGRMGRTGEGEMEDWGDEEKQLKRNQRSMRIVTESMGF